MEKSHIVTRFINHKQMRTAMPNAMPFAMRIAFRTAMRKAMPSSCSCRERVYLRPTVTLTPRLRAAGGRDAATASGRAVGE